MKRMKPLRQGDFCPLCGKGAVKRIRRLNWMRWLPQSKCYKCPDCLARIVTVYGRTLSLKKYKHEGPGVTGRRI
jgi:hypothetical protein